MILRYLRHLLPGNTPLQNESEKLEKDYSRHVEKELNAQAGNM